MKNKLIKYGMISSIMGILATAPISTQVYAESTQPNEVYVNEGDVFMHEMMRMDSRTVVRTINYVYEDGSVAAETSESVVSFIREGTEDLSTGDVYWTAWRPVRSDTFESVNSPKIDGYKADRAVVSGVRVSENSDNIKEVVIYRADVQKRDSDKKTDMAAGKISVNNNRVNEIKNRENICETTYDDQETEPASVERSAETPVTNNAVYTTESAESVDTERIENDAAESLLYSNMCIKDVVNKAFGIMISATMCF